MDDLDSLLEELAKTSSQNAKGGKANSQSETGKTVTEPGLIPPVYTSRVPAMPSQSSIEDHVYSQIQEPAGDTQTKPCSATLELDSLMQQLMGLDTGNHSNKKEKEENKEKEGGQATEGNSGAPRTRNQAAYETPKTDAIDNLLGSLSSDMEKMGVHTKAKGHCASCGKCIAGKIVTALGEVWHPEHFVCTVCRVELSIRGFFEREGKAYCEKDYQDLFAPRCAYCKAPILQNILTAMDRSWHPEHFFCVECGDVFGPDGYMEHEGKPYCTRDFYRLFAPKCSGCREPVRDNYLSAINGTWHPHCFVCTDCLSPLTDGFFMELDGRPLCTLHYHSRQGMLCGGCGAPISGRCISAMDRKFHPEHFVCAFCLRQLSKGVFKEQGGKPYCASCHSKLFL